MRHSCAAALCPVCACGRWVLVPKCHLCVVWAARCPARQGQVEVK